MSRPLRLPPWASKRPLMKTEILSIGSELTSGQNLDTNSQWLSLRLGEIGVPVHFHTTVADELEDNVDVFQTAARRASVVIATGGLGPTQDDLTREALARLAGVELALHQASLDHIRSMFARRNREMPERNHVQALFPAGAEPIPNRHGTAPGIYLHHGDCHLFALPGVPSEMRAMFEEEVKPRLAKLGIGGGVVVQRKINCFGAGESAIEAKVFDLTRRGHVPEVGITVTDATISLRILARAANAAEARKQIEPVERTIGERLGSFVFGVEEEELEDAVLRLLAEKRKTLATAESLTGGLIARRICRVPGASVWFRGGVVAYQNEVKIEQLGVPRELIEEHGVVSGPVAEAMAVGCRGRFHCDVAVSTTGFAGPGGGSDEKPVGLAYAGLAWGGGQRSASFNWPGNRVEVQSRAAKMALNLVRLHLLGAAT
jgi:competence/damage-inducible protein CinA-like protein